MDPRTLIHRYLLGDISDAEMQQLERMLADDAELRQQFVLAAATETGLRDIAIERASEPVQAGSPTGSANHRSTSGALASMERAAVFCSYTKER